MRTPRDAALDVYGSYYSGGSYSDDRLKWTFDTFIIQLSPANVLEIGCGDGILLGLLANRGIRAQGVDASSTGITRCLQRGLQAQCLDVSSETLPFSDSEFDLVVSLETFEHLMNPHYALQEVRRVLRPGGTFICSIPNPLTGHPYIYPGLFEYRHFRRFLNQSGFAIERVLPWQWAPRETILPEPLRNAPLLSARWVAGPLRRLVEASFRAFGGFPAFCYWLWTFDCRNQIPDGTDIFMETCARTCPGSDRHF